MVFLNGDGGSRGLHEGIKDVSKGTRFIGKGGGKMHGLTHKMIVGESMKGTMKRETFDRSSLLNKFYSMPMPFSIRIKMKGERGSPCLIPIEGEKVVVGEPLRRMEKKIKEIKEYIQWTQEG